MGSIALVPGDCRSRAVYLSNRELPDNYMADFTVLGFVVDQYRQSVTLLQSAGYTVQELQGGADIRIDTPVALLQIHGLLRANHINCDLADIADTLYQA